MARNPLIEAILFLARWRIPSLRDQGYDLVPRLFLPLASVRDNRLQIIVEFRRILFARLPHLVHNFVFDH